MVSMATRRFLGGAAGAGGAGDGVAVGTCVAWPRDAFSPHPAVRPMAAAASTIASARIPADTTGARTHRKARGFDFLSGRRHAWHAYGDGGGGGAHRSRVRRGPGGRSGRRTPDGGGR